MPTPNNIYIDKALTNLSIGYQNNDIAFIADEVFPKLSVKDKTGLYYEFDKANLRTDSDERAPGTAANEVGYELIKRNYGPLIDHALKLKVTEEEVDEADDALEPFNDGTEFLTEKMKMNKEVDAAGKYAGLSANITLAGGQQFSDYVNSDPGPIIRTGINAVKSQILKKPNTLITGYEVFDMLLNHPALKKQLGDDQDQLLDTARVAKFLGVDRIIVGDAQQNTGKEGQSDSLAYVWGKNIYLAYLEPNPGKRKMSAAYGLEMTNGWEMARWWDQNIHSTFIELRRFYLHAFTNTSAVYKIAAVIA